jgi:NAD(P)-dependent dehydrogenase (short-subunit alcohol dehydrogenase family)
MNVSSLFNLDGKRALVTGASRGIGRMIAEGLLSAGVTVHICAPDEAEVMSARSELLAFGECRALVADVSSIEDVNRLGAHIDEHGGRLNILVNNAAIARAMPFEDFERQAFEDVLSVNLTGPFDISRRLVAALRLASRPGDPSRIINIASVEGIRPPAEDLD